MKELPEETKKVLVKENITELMTNQSRTRKMIEAQETASDRRATDFTL